MKKAAFHSSGRLDIDMLIGRFRFQRFVFTADGSSFDITGFTWNLVVKENRGSIPNLLSYTIGHGLAFGVYEENILEARFAAADVSKTLMHGEGKKYWELVRTDTNEIWLSGELNLQYGLLDSDSADQDVTVNLADETVTVELQAIVYVAGSGGGGTVENPYRGDYTSFEASGFPTMGGSDAGGVIKIGDRWRLLFSNVNQIITIAGVDYFHNYIIEYAGSGLWNSYAANNGATS